jgi:hypothetical protein
MTERKAPALPSDDKSPRDKTVRKPPAMPEPVPEPATKITPVDRKVGEGPGNLRDRADAFNRRRGGKS